MALAAVLAASCGALVGCLIDLPSACGDGSLDPATEDCDPAVDGAPDDCDPTTCKRIAVSSCGDGKLDPGEACDTSDYGNKSCPSGEGYLSCTSDCKLDESTCQACGNGRVDPGEECDQSAGGIGGFTQPKACVDLTTYPVKRYTSGTTSDCDHDTCQWRRVSCGYCGDDVLDAGKLVDPEFPAELSQPEFCDGSKSQLDELRAYCDDNCPVTGLQCEPRCTDDCRDFAPPPDDLRCCLEETQPCPKAGDPAPCCVTYDLDDPFDSQLACEDRKIGMFVQRVCK